MICVDTAEEKYAGKFDEYKAFFAERVPRPEAVKYQRVRQKKENLQKRGKLLTYARLDRAMQSLVDQSRLSEWNNYLKFGATKVIPKSEAEELINKTGCEELPTQWIDVDKNEFKRQESKKERQMRAGEDKSPTTVVTEIIEPKMKSRLVARGDLFRVFNRSDSPTADNEAVFLVLSFAASRRLRI